MKKIFLQVCKDGETWETCSRAYLEVAFTSMDDLRNTIQALATLTGKKVRASYPDNKADNPCTLNGHYFDPR